MSDEDVLEQAQRWLSQGHSVALATVVRTWGSAPRPAGSQFAVNDLGSFVGSISGGCVEGAVAAEAREVLKTGQVRNLSFGVSNETAWEVGLACGGQIEVFVEPIQ
jgi:xanthine/CO dehydrogenase XdhC/CoxF family maturation factor